jgi:hypothetical protein
MLPSKLSLETNNIDPSGTSLQGYFTATRDQLERWFGLPTYDNEEFDPSDKIQTEWCVKISDHVVTIYAWKVHRLVGKNEVFEWNIGGRSVVALRALEGFTGRSGRSATGGMVGGTHGYW